MEKEDKIINYNGERYIIVNSITYMGQKYIFVINYNNMYDVKLLICLNDLEEVNDIEMIRNVITQMV